MHRLFVAIDFPDLVREHLALLCFGLPDARWVPREQLHLTLRFIGEVEGSRFLDVREALAAVAFGPFDMRLKGIGHFPPRGRPNVLWAGVERNGPLEALHGKVEAALARTGVAPEGRNFAPHVTLARLKGTPPRRVADYLTEHALFTVGPFPVAAFQLYSSLLSPKGAVHTLEASYPLLPVTSPEEEPA